MSKTANWKLVMKFNRILNARSLEELKDNTALVFEVAGCVGVLQEWLSGGMKETPLEIATTVHDIILLGPAILK
jgi:hypothetical protein